jgi:hypothetical protein
MPGRIQARASKASRCGVGSGVEVAGGVVREQWFAGTRLSSGVTDEDRALAGVCEPEADDCGDAMVLGVWHEMDGSVYCPIAADDLPPDEGLEAVPSGLWIGIRRGGTWLICVSCVLCG